MSDSPAAESLRWALLGASWIAETRFIPGLRRSGQEIVSVVSGSQGRAESFADQHGIPLATNDLGEGLERSRPDAVYISSTNDRHRELTEAAAARGIHVLCEKPLADNLSDAWSIVAACREANVVLGVNHHLVAAGTHTVIRDLVGDGAIGHVRAVRVHHARHLPEFLQTWRLSDKPGAGVVPDVSSHDASLVNALLAPTMPNEAIAIGVRQGEWQAGSDDAAMAVIRYDEVIVQLHDAFTTPFAPTRFEVLGSEGAIVGTDVLTQDPVGDVHLYTQSGTRSINVADREDLYTKVIAGFVRATLGEGRATVTGEEAILAAAVAMAVDESARTGVRVTVKSAPPA